MSNFIVIPLLLLRTAHTTIRTLVFAKVIRTTNDVMPVLDTGIQEFDCK
ncbi:hypothetical protein [Wolbachia endosymbiont (group A) of Agelastica alni]